jgi:hypothetical protein
MRDNDLFTYIISTIQQGLIKRNITGITILQSYQPTMQGTVSTPVIYLSKLSQLRRGMPSKIDTYDDINDVIDHEEGQVYESSFQIMTLWNQDPEIDTLTSSDLINSVAGILQSEFCIQNLSAYGIQILKILNINNPYFRDDRDYFELSPSLEITLTYNEYFTEQVDEISLFNYGLYSV